ESLRARARSIIDLATGVTKPEPRTTLPIVLAQYIFEVLRYGPSEDEQLGFRTALAALSMRPRVSEHEHPLLVEGQRRQKDDLATMLICAYKDDLGRLSDVLDRLLDRPQYQQPPPQPPVPKSSSPYTVGQLPPSAQASAVAAAVAAAAESNKPTEALAHHMFELAKTLQHKAGGSAASAPVFQQDPTGGNNGPHRYLQLAAFQVGLYALGLYNCVNSTWQSRTYSSHVSWIQNVVTEVGTAALSILLVTWRQHLTPPEVAVIADKVARNRDQGICAVAAQLCLDCLHEAHTLNPQEIRRCLDQCKDQSLEVLEKGLYAVDASAKKMAGGVHPTVLFQVAKQWYELYESSAPPASQPVQRSTVPSAARMPPDAPIITSQAAAAASVFWPPPQAPPQQPPQPLPPQSAAQFAPMPGPLYPPPPGCYPASHFGHMTSHPPPPPASSSRDNSRFGPNNQYGGEVQWALSVAVRLDYKAVVDYCTLVLGCIHKPDVLEQIIRQVSLYSQASPASHSTQSEIVKLTNRLHKLYHSYIDYRLNHLTTNEWDDLVSYILRAHRAKEDFPPIDPNQQWQQLLTSIKNHPKCKKDLWNRIMAGVQTIHLQHKTGPAASCGESARNIFSNFRPTQLGPGSLTWSGSRRFSHSRSGRCRSTSASRTSVSPSCFWPASRRTRTVFCASWCGSRLYKKRSLNTTGFWPRRTSLVCAPLPAAASGRSDRTAQRSGGSDSPPPTPPGRSLAWISDTTSSEASRSYSRPTSTWPTGDTSGCRSMTDVSEASDSADPARTRLCPGSYSEPAQTNSSTLEPLTGGVTRTGPAVPGGRIASAVARLVLVLAAGSVHLACLRLCQRQFLFADGAQLGQPLRAQQPHGQVGGQQDCGKAQRNHDNNSPGLHDFRQSNESPNYQISSQAPSEQLGLAMARLDQRTAATDEGRGRTRKFHSWHTGARAWSLLESLFKFSSAPSKANDLMLMGRAVGSNLALLMLAPLVLASLVLASLVLAPLVLKPLVLKPLVLASLVLAPLVLKPLVLKPLVLAPLVLAPWCWRPWCWRPWCWA
uniref:75k gamma secalin n=1 Tax=Macrostomum lignano TaxID=282301 RepID=A0A1I8GVE9_9PLAT